ncbi:MAG: SgcJ/EcaC family oxidoreductase [Acidobacteria bacterium]|nr:SgcJ/EcaC family oxidoreductase [Acidobacteriota bacterium]
MELNTSAQADEQAIRMMVDQAISRMNKGDITVVEDFWDENADYVSVDGRLIAGRAQMKAFFSEILRLSAGGIQQVSTIESIRFLTPELAIVDGSWTISGARDESGTELAPLKGRGVEIAQKRDGQWRFVATREMVVFRGS